MDHLSRYSIGIDLGTTNSVLSYFDSWSAEDEPRVLSIPQLADPGDVHAFSELPSFLYFPTEHDRASGELSLPWSTEQPVHVCGVMARELGTLAPGRQITSAKSWLCQPSADRRARILPWQAIPSAPKLSPVEASAAYLAHLRDAWNYEMAKGDGMEWRLENQDVVLTVPASFDEEARELTVEAAHAAGLHRLTLLEEPLAAFYAWMTRQRDAVAEQLREGDLVLVCDIGGGTSDFTLIRAHLGDAGVEFERTAIGEHLLLGGDNLDAALARRMTEKLAPEKLGLRQLQVLQRKCTLAKEHLMADSALDHISISIPGSGKSLTGGLVTVDLLRKEVEDVLADGFLPLTPSAAAKARERKSGLKELGLAYAADPAITRHLSAFLAQAAVAMHSQPKRDRSSSAMARPDAILFNGGFCTPTFVRERIAEAVASWFWDEASTWHPKVLNDEVTSSPVAMGAAQYGMVRRGLGKRIRAGSARTYYIGLRSDRKQLEGVCVLPFGVNEGTLLPPTDREFNVVANRPASFDLFSSRTRRDAQGDVIVLDEEDAHRHAPLVTLLRYGKKLRDVELAVRLRVGFTETGTLEIWCESKDTPHRWKLQFELRSDEGRGEDSPALEGALLAPTQHKLQERIGAAEELIRACFSTSGSGNEVSPLTLVSKLEDTLSMKRDHWPLTTARALCETLSAVAEGRAKSAHHEVRWHNLFGFCLRPGFGADGDDRRILVARRLHQAGLTFPADVPAQVEWLVLWRRLAGGLNASFQQELYRSQMATLGLGGKRSKGRVNKQIEHEALRLLAALEHLTSKQRVAIGNEILTKLEKEPDDAHSLWALGRLGARIPLYGPLSCVVPAETASAWLGAILNFPEFTSATAFACVQLAMQCDDPERDVGEAVRKKVMDRLKKGEAKDQFSRHIQESFPLTRSEAELVFGESLPEGLRIVSSLNCILPVTALTSDWQKAV